MTVALHNDDHRAIARSVCTAKEYEAWELVEIHRMSQRNAAYFLDLSHGAVRGRLENARAKIARYIQAEFPGADTPTEDVVPDVETVAGNALRMIRSLLVERDGATCYLCRVSKPPEVLHVEHVIPKSRGGSDSASNLKLACGRCNTKKGDQFVSLRVSSGRPVYHPV